MEGGLHYFLDAAGASLAFLKEQDEPNWDAAITHEADVGQNPLDELPGLGSEDYLVTSDLRKATVLFNPTDKSATYAFTVYGMMESNNNPGWYELDHGSYSGLTGNFSIQVNVQGMSGLYVYVNSLSAESLHVEMAPIEFERP